MAIQWFPGHMHVTRKAIAERIKLGIDVVIELLDARMPGASANPLLASLTAGKPALKLLNKQDRAIALDASERAPAQRLVKACRELAPLRGGMAKPLRVLICGIPNVGKSTLINTLVGKKSAKTGDEAGITKIEQCIMLASDFKLFDTPGMLWPKIEVPQCGYLLAACGAIGRNAYDEQEVAFELLELLQSSYAARIESRYRLSDVAAMKSELLLEAIARQRGLVQTGGRINLQKAAEVVLNDFRAAALGAITLETPAEHAGWQAAALAQAQADEALRLARKGGRSGR